MRTSTLLLALPALSLAEQVPLMDQVMGQVQRFFGSATSSISSAASSAAPSSIPNPVASGTAAIASLAVTDLTASNYRSVLKPGAATASPGLEEWMIFVTGGNKTCHGLCESSEQAYNGSIPLLATSSTPPNLAYLSCEREAALCHAWAVSPPRVLHMMIPQPLADQSIPPTTVRAIQFNRTTVTAPQVAAIHLEEKYKDADVYEGFWHPFDGPLAKYGLNLYAGYVIWGFSLVPSWAFMILVSFVSRNIMSRQASRRAPPAGAAAGAPPAAAQ